MSAFAVDPCGSADDADPDDARQHLNGCAS